MGATENERPQEKVSRTTDGREIASLAIGPRDGLPLIWHHGNPGSRIPLISRSDADDLGLFVIGYDRPGCGGSTALPGRVVADLAPDVESVADAWGVERFITAGISGGGAFALGTAALFPERCVAAAVLSGAAPVDAEGLEFREGMTATNVTAADDAALPRDRASLLAEGEPMRQELLRDPGAALDRFAGEFPEVDRRALEDPALRDAVARGMAECVRRTAEGWLDDSAAFGSPWGFDVATIRAPVSIWQGIEDTATPIHHARWLAGRIPKSELHELAGGHYAPLQHLPAIARWLRRHMSR